MAQGSNSEKNGWVENYTRWVVKNKWLVIFLVVLGTMAIASGGRFLGFSNNYRIFFGKKNPDLQAFENLQDTYTKNDNVLIVLAPKNGDVFSKETLAAVRELTEEGWQVPFSTRVDSLSNFQHTEGREEELIVEDLIPENETDLTRERLAKIRDISFSEPLILNRLLSAKGDVTAVNITVELPGKDPMEVLQVASDARERVENFKKKYPDIEFYLSGIVLLNEAFAAIGQKDMMTLTPVMYLIILVLLALLLKSVSGTLTTLAVICLSVIAGMGFAGWAGILLTPPSAIAPTVILTLAVADSVHILMIMLSEMRKGLGKLDALVESMRVNMQPVFLTSVTTCIGFLSLNFSEQPPYQHLGNITAFGVVMAFILSVTLLPALVSLFPFKVKVQDSKKSLFLSKLADFVVNRRKPVFIVTATIVVGLTAFVPTIELNDQFVEYFDKTTDFRNDTDIIVDRLTGIYQLEYSIPAQESGGVSEPEYLKKLDEFANWFRKDPRVVHVNTLTDTMKRLNKNMHGDDPSYYRLPDDRELSAQYLLLYEMSLPYGLDLNNQIDIDKSATRLVVTMGNVSAKDMRELALTSENWLKENAPAYMQSRGTGPSIMFSKISKRNVQGMTNGFILALGLITLFMIIALRSLGMGFLSLIPNIVPITMSMGVWALIEGQAGTAISIVASVTLGIVVDDTIHFLSKYMRAKRENGFTVAESIKYAFETVGPALLITTVVLTIGFSVLMASTFRLNWTLGFLSAATLVLAIFADFIFLPSMMSLFGGKK